MPSRSDTVLVMTTTYNTDGTVQDVTDPKGIVARTEYDAGGRVTRRIANYVDGTPGGGAADDEDQTIRFEYTNGLQTKYIADLASDDQETVYTFGVPKGTGAGDSALASNRLLWKVQYPESSGGTDVVMTAYNALGQVTSVKDQAGNIIDTAYDLSGRPVSRVANTVAAGFDSTIRGIGTSYLSRGGVDKVTQYSDTAMTTATDQVKHEYDGWGNLETLTQDVDGVIGAGGIAARSVSYTYAANTGSGKPNVLRRTGQTLPGSFSLNYLYTGTVNGNASRLYEVNVEAGATDVPIATYEYLGSGTVVSTALPEPNASTGVFNSGATTYPDIDDFGRVTTSDWKRGTVPYVDFRLAYDRNGNITSETDEMVARQVTGGGWTANDHYFDRVFTNDSLNRLTKNDEGHMSGSTIASAKHTRIEEWTLSQTGNWSNQKLDLNGDGDQGDTSERDWNGTFNKANECTARGGNSPAYDAPGNMTDDGVNYSYVYDAFGRLKTVKTRGGSPTTVSEYTYNGLGHRIGWHYDADADADVDANDPWYWFFYDERWRMVATYRGSDSNPKERFVYHNAGMNGYGGSSYIDSVILRDCDDSVDWKTAAPDSTLQTRYYYLQNWRADVVALIQADGVPLEYVRYSAYGVPFVYAAADVNRDGVVNVLDTYAWDDFTGSTTGDIAVSPDVNRDGATNSADATFISDWDGTGLWSGSGRGFVSRLDSRKGYAGYEFDPSTTQWHVRHRVLVSEMGRWSRRDPLGYVDGASTLQFSRSSVVERLDYSGMRANVCVSNAAGCIADEGPIHDPLPLLPRWHPTIGPPPGSVQVPSIACAARVLECRLNCRNLNREYIRTDCYAVSTPKRIELVPICICGSYYVPGACTVARHEQLQDLVDQLCTNYSCSGMDPYSSLVPCSAYTDRAHLAHLCAQARENINNECFGGGDRGHLVAAGNARLAEQGCLRKAGICYGRE